ncbi:MAG: Uma2 family endonuclease [Gemmataceae bacterium]
MSSVMVTDPVWAEEISSKRIGTDANRWNEMWNGVLVMPTLPNNQHQEIQNRIQFALTAAFEMSGRGKVFGGVNVTDTDEGWLQNHRCPDVVLYLPENPAENCGTHWVGGPDFLVEIISPGDLTWDKLEFYAEVGTREVLIIDRNPWKLERYQLRDGVLEPAGESDLANPAVLTSAVMPLAFQLREGRDRPAIHMTHTATGQTWTA